MRQCVLVAMVFCCLITWCLSSQAEEKRTEPGVAITIYTASAPKKKRDGWDYEYKKALKARYAIVKEYRFMDLKEGLNHIKFTDVAKNIKPETVHFVSLTDPEGTFVLEQNYEYDLISGEKLLEKYIDRKITLVTEKENGEIETEEVTLLAKPRNKSVVRRDDPDNPIEIRYLGRVRLGTVPGGLITRPALVWTVKARRAGRHLCRVAYETSGIFWHASYTAVVNEEDNAVDLSGWVTIENRSGATYNNARVKLVAGDVRAGATGKGTNVRMRSGGRQEMRAQEGGFKGKRFFEFHLYTLARPSTLKDNSQKQLELFQPVSNVPARKILVYHGAKEFPSFFGSPKRDRDIRGSSNNAVDIYLVLENSKAAGLGFPLPGGRARAYKEDPDDGALEFIGEDDVDHAPAGGDVMIRLGSAFDLVGERRRTSFKCDYDKHFMVESFEITVANHKEEDVEVLVREVLYRWVNWEITAKSQDYKKIDSRMIHFPVKIPAGSEKKITYTVTYTW